MKFIWALVLCFFGLAFSVPKYLKDCVENSVHIGDFIDSVESYTGKAYKVYLKKQRRTGKCLYTVKGERGTAIVDAETGEIVKFYKKR